MTSSIYRDFSRYYPEGSDEHVYSLEKVGDVGGIHIVLVEGNKLFITIMGLHDNGCGYFDVDFGGQAMLRVTIDPSIDLYDAIITVLDKITEDHRYSVKNPYKDFVLCSEYILEKAPHLCHANGDGDGTNMGGKWAYFTRETLAYVGMDERWKRYWDKEEQEKEQKQDESETNKNKRIYIDGEVKLGGDGQTMFTYDYPIISNDAGQKYYELTRGKCVTKVEYSDLYPGNKDYEEFLELQKTYFAENQTPLHIE